jgi:hypothetical protein
MPIKAINKAGTWVIKHKQQDSLISQQDDKSAEHKIYKNKIINIANNIKSIKINIITNLDLYKTTITIIFRIALKS